MKSGGSASAERTSTCRRRSCWYAQVASRSRCTLLRQISQLKSDSLANRTYGFLIKLILFIERGYVATIDLIREL
jgi:hypothetical protein